MRDCSLGLEDAHRSSRARAPLYKSRFTGREVGYCGRNAQELGGLPDLICDLASRLEERLAAPLMGHLHRTNLIQVPNSGFFFFSTKD